MTLLQKLTSTLALATLAASPAIAQPTLVGTFEGETPDGNNAFLFEVNSDDLVGSYALELAFETTVLNSSNLSTNAPSPDSFSAATTEQANTDFAATFGADTGFSILEDTYFFDANLSTPNPGNNPFTGTETTGFIQTPSSLFLSFGTATDLGDSFSVVRIVTSDDSIAFSGIVAQEGINNLVSGVVAVPEPTTAALLSLGGMAFLARKRRQA